MDRTNWSRGETEYNYLSVGILVEGVFIPIVATDLGEKGNSGTEGRLELIDRFLLLWGHTKKELPVFYVTGDREFVGSEWLTELEKRALKFVVRIRCNMKFYPWLHGGMGIEKTGVVTLQRYLRLYGMRATEVVLDSGFIVRFVAVDNDNMEERKSDPFVFLLTNLDGDPGEAAEIYRKRYRIESFFRHMKSNGFNLEQLNLKGTHKTNLMFAILGLIYTMATLEGLWGSKTKPLKNKKFRNGVFQSKSTFLFGLARLKDRIEKIWDFFRCLIQTVKDPKLCKIDICLLYTSPSPRD